MLLSVSVGDDYSESQDFFLYGFAVFAASLNALAVGAPLVPGFRIFSPDPSAILFLFAAILL